MHEPSSLLTSLMNYQRELLRLKGEAEALALEFEHKANMSRYRLIRWHYRRMAKSLREDLLLFD